MFKSLIRSFAGARSDSVAVEVPEARIEDIPSQYARTVTRDTDDINNEIARLRDKRRLLLPFEADLSTRYEERIALWQDELAASELGLDRHFKRLDMGFLRLTRVQDNLRVPRFGVFDINQTEPTCFVGIHAVWTQPKAGQAQYTLTLLEETDETMKQFADYSALSERAEDWRGAFETQLGRRGRAFSLFARFSAAIPELVREQVHQVRNLFDQVLLVAEVTQWEAGTVGAGDPLFVGRKGRLYWLIVKFDTTPIEEYVSKEFTTS